MHANLIVEIHDPYQLSDLHFWCTAFCQNQQLFYWKDACVCWLTVPDKLMSWKTKKILCDWVLSPNNFYHRRSIPVFINQSHQWCLKYHVWTVVLTMLIVFVDRNPKAHKCWPSDKTLPNSKTHFWKRKENQGMKTDGKTKGKNTKNGRNCSQNERNLSSYL